MYVYTRPSKVVMLICGSESPHEAQKSAKYIQRSTK